jgi:hypothetical protein
MIFGFRVKQLLNFQTQTYTAGKAERKTLYQKGFEEDENDDF